MAPILQEAVSIAPHFFIVVSVALFVLLVISCAGGDDTPRKTSGNGGKVTGQRARPVQGGQTTNASPAVPATHQRQPKGSSSSDNKNAQIRDSSEPSSSDFQYINQEIPVLYENAEAHASMYMNLAAAGTQLEPLKFDTSKIIGTLKKSLDSRKIDEKLLELGDVIGKGEFGLVYKGSLHNKNKTQKKEVAVKTVHGNHCTEEDLKNFLQEVLRMCGFDHHNVQSTIGICFKDSQPYAIIPFMDYGDLRSYTLATDKNMTIRKLLEFGLQIAKGMEYLAKQKFVHRDLAARNCMIDKKLVVKVADFGLSRDIFTSDYYRMNKNSTTPLPVRWMAPESLRNKVYTVKSDVWSYGIVLWELMTRGMVPYNKMSAGTAMAHVLKGGRLEKPDGCPQFVYNLLMFCWNSDPQRRPDFNFLVKEVNKVLKK